MIPTQPATFDYILDVPSIYCVDCVNTILRALEGNQDLSYEFVTIDALTGKMKVVGITNKNLEELIGTVEDVGHEIRVDQISHDNVKTLKRHTIIGFAIGLPIMLLIIFISIPSPLTAVGQIIHLLLGAVDLIFMCTIGRSYFYHAWNDILNRRASMDLLVALGTGGAWGYSMLITLLPTLFPLVALQTYFASVIIIFAVIKLGKYFLEKIKEKINQEREQAFAHMARDFPENISLIDEQQLYQVDARAIVPVNSIYEGSKEALFSERQHSGESKAILKKTGDIIKSGSINLGGPIQLQAVENGCDSHVYKWLQALKLKIFFPRNENMEVRYLKYFIPAVLLIALITAVTWALLAPAPALPYVVCTTLSVFLCACPCVFGLAIPIALAIAMSTALRNAKILFGDDSIFMNAKDCKVIVFDKTGTLTLGTPIIKEAYLPEREDQIDQLVMSLESHSNHPLAAAFSASEQKQELLPVVDVESHENGITGVVGKDTMHIGNEAYLKALGITLGHHFLTKRDEFLREGSEPIFVACNKRCVGVYGVFDPVRIEAKTLIHDLQNMGYHIVMLTGSQQSVAEKIETLLEAEQKIEIVANQTPSDKKEYIKALNRQQKVIMIGDYFNDQDAMKEATISVALGSWYTMGIADVVLQDSLLDLIPTLEIIKTTAETIKSNLKWSLFYNSIAILFAAGVFYPICGILLNPVIATIAMSLSSIVLVINSLRLKWKVDSIFQKIAPSGSYSSIGKLVPNLGPSQVNEDLQLQPTPHCGSPQRECYNGETQGQQKRLSGEPRYLRL